MGEVFLISDTHFGHKKILDFKRNDGTPLRNFSSLTDMHVQMVERWNSVVNSGDKVYHLGDVAFSTEGLKLLAMCNGIKRLVRGNHDLRKTTDYLQYFKEIYGVRQINGIWLTHVPMHLDCVLQERVKMNVHGHLHANKIDHPKYFNASVECIDYTPVSIDEVYRG